MQLRILIEMILTVLQLYVKRHTLQSANFFNKYSPFIIFSDRQSWNDEFTTAAILEHCTEELMEGGGREVGRK